MESEERAALKLLTGFFLSVLSGVLLWISLPGKGPGWVAWVALVPLFVALLKYASARMVFGLYYALSIGIMALGLVWGAPRNMSIIYAAPLIAAAVFFLLTFWQKPLVDKNHNSSFTVLTVVSFVGIEFVKQYTPVALFGSLGLTQYRNPELIQAAGLLGVYGITFAIVMANCTIALLIARADKLDAIKMQLMADVMVLVILGGATYYLWVMPARVDGRMRVAAVQFNYQRSEGPSQGLEKWLQHKEQKDWRGMTMAALDILEPMTERAVGQGALMVVWPETVLQVDPERHPDIAMRLSSLANRLKVYIIVPYFSIVEGQEGLPHPEFENVAAVISPNGRLIQRYLKQRRFGLFGYERGPSGDRTELVSTITATIGLMICYDADFPAIPRDYALKGAEVFVVPTDDIAGFISDQHRAIMVFRAVENMRTLIKSDLTNGTLIIGPKGRILADPPDRLVLSVSDIELVSANMPSYVLSVLFGLSCLILIPVVAFFSARQKDSDQG